MTKPRDSLPGDPQGPDQPATQPGDPFDQPDLDTRFAELSAHADRLRDALDRAGVDNDVQTHPDAGHAFLDPEPGGPWWLQPVFRLQHTGPHPEQAGLAWERIDAFLDRHLRAG